MMSLWGVTVALVAALLAAPPADARTGVLDRDFGRRGLVRTDFGPGADSASALSVLGDGRILVAGTTHGPRRGTIALTRHTPAGTLDPTFGSGGKVAGTFPGDAEATALAVSAEGQIFVAGSISPKDADRRAMLVTRHDADGNPDSAFGDEGRVVLRIGSTDARARAIAAVPDGSLIVVGSLGGGAHERVVVARLDAAGRLDSEFGTGGIVRADLGGSSAGGFAVALDADGRIVVAGRVDRDLAVVRFDAQGDIDSGFGDDGVTRIDVEGGFDLARAIAVRDGVVVVAGTTSAQGESDFVVVRLDDDGDPDASFGEGGLRRTDLGGIESAHALALQPDGSIVVAGQTTNEEGSDLALVAYRPDGELVEGFGRGGRVRTDLKSAADAALALALQHDKLIAAGVRGIGPTAEMVLVRFHEAPPECGDGFTEGEETCDAGAKNGEEGSCCSASCGLRASGEACRSAAGLCDVAETCDGKSPICPDDMIRPAEFSCRPAAGWCDLPEECSGVSKTCPDDKVRDSDAVCRAAIGPCDASELCDGESPECPADAKSTDVCRPAVSDCDLPETCDGKSDQCPADELQQNGNACYDRNPCTTDEVCHDGECIGGTFDPYKCAAMLCRQWTGELLSPKEAPGPRAVSDDFEQGSFRVVKQSFGQTFLCSRASLTGETWDDLAMSGDPAFADAPAQHRISVAGRLEPTDGELVDGLVVVDRFGRRPVTLEDTRRLSVPARVVGGDGAPEALSPQRRKCYPVKRQPWVAGGKRFPLWIGDEALHFDVRQLKQLCVPANVNGEPSASTTAVACYSARRSRGEPPLERTSSRLEVETALDYRFALTEADKEFVCVPAMVEPRVGDRRVALD